MRASSESNWRGISRRCSAQPYKAKGPRKPETFRCKYRWLRGHATSGTCSYGAVRRDRRHRDLTTTGPEQFDQRPYSKTPMKASPEGALPKRETESPDP